MKRLHPTPELMTKNPTLRPVRVSARIRGAARLSISDVTDQVSPDSDSRMKSRDIKLLSKSDNVEDEVYPSPKSKSNESCKRNTKAKRKRSKKELSSSSVINEENNAKRGRYTNQTGARIEKSNASLEIKCRGTDNLVDNEMSAKKPKASGGTRKSGDVDYNYQFSFGYFKTEQINDAVDLDTSVSSVEVSADEKEEEVATRCDWCKKKFDEKDWGKLNRHKKLSHDTPCPNCDVMFVDKIDLAKHSKEYHSIGSKRQNYSYECRKCLKKNRTFQGNLKHEELEHPHKCGICIVENVIFPFSFINEKGLEVHQEQRHKNKVKEADKINLSTEDATLEGDESKESVESVELVVVKPKLIKGKKIFSGSKRKSSKKTKPKFEELQENEKAKKCNQESRKNIDNKLSLDYSNKNESMVEESNEDKEYVRVMDTIETTKENKFDYSHFIVNESLLEDGMIKEVLPNEQIEEKYNLASKYVNEEYVSKVVNEAKMDGNQIRSNDIKIIEEKHWKEAEFIDNSVEIEIKEPLVDREANEKGTEMQVNNVVLKRASNDNIQDSEISTTSQNILEVFNEQNSGVDMIIGISSNEVKENYIFDHTEDKIELNNQDKDSWNNQENETREIPQKLSQKISSSNKTLDQGMDLVVCKGIKAQETLDSPLDKDDKNSNCEKEVPKFSQNCKERSVPPVKKRKEKTRNLTVVSKVNGKLQVKPASSTKSSGEQWKNIGKVPGVKNSSEKLVMADNNGNVENNMKMDGDSEHLSKEKETLSIQDIKQESGSKLLGINDQPENVAELSSGLRENLYATEGISEDFKPPEKFVSSVSHKVSNMDDTMNSMIELDCQSSVDFQIGNESSKNEGNENLNQDKPFCPCPLPDFLEDVNQVEVFHTKLSLAKTDQETESTALDVDHFSESNFREQAVVSNEDSTIHNTYTNDSTTEVNISSYANTNDDLVMKNEFTQKESNLNVGENVTPDRSTMHKPFNGLNLISRMYLNISSETDSPSASHFPEVLDSDSPLGQPIGSSSPCHVKTESIPMKISKLQGIQSFKDPRPTREVWKVRKPETITVPHDDVNREATATIAILNSKECKSIAKDSEIGKLECEPELNDSLDEFGLDVIDSPEKKIETYDISNLLQLNPKYSGLEPEKEKPTQLLRDRSLTSIEELLESDGDDDKPIKSDLEDDQHSTKRYQLCEVSDKTKGKAKLKMKKSKEAVSLTCLYCERTFNRESYLKNHMLFAHYISSKDSFVCDLCQHHFKNKSHLSDHIKISHDYKCERCTLRFHARSQMESHSIDAHPNGPLDLTDLEENDGLKVKPLECELCKAIFPWEEFVKHTELSHTYPCELQLDPEANYAPHLWFVSNNDRAWHVHREHAGPKPDYEEKPEETSQSQTEISNPENFHKSVFNCELCRKEFDNRQPFDEHKKRAHKYSLGSDLDQYVRFSNDRKRFESVTCCMCGLEFEEVQQFEKHSRILHPFACSHGDCVKRFTNQRNFSDHLTKDHSITYLNVYGEKNTIKLTATRSIANIEMIRSVEEWMRSEEVVDHMVRVMKGELKSRRHELFMDRKERAQSGGLKASKLYVLSNPAFMGDAGERDSSVIQYLIDEVFNLHFHSSDPRLLEIGINSGFTYATTVLFPEMFLNQHQVKNGFSREEAERAFLEIEVTDEEREGLEQEIREGVVAQEDEEFSDNEWVDEPDLIENDWENTTIIVDESE